MFQKLAQISRRMWVDGAKYENEIEVERIMALSYVSWPLTISSNKNEIVVRIYDEFWNSWLQVLLP